MGATMRAVLQAVDKLDRHPGQDEDAKLAQPHEAEQHHVGEEVGGADDRLIGQRPGFAAQYAPQQAVANSLPECGFGAHPAPEVTALRSQARHRADCGRRSARRRACRPHERRRLLIFAAAPDSNCAVPGADSRPRSKHAERDGDNFSSQVTATGRRPRDFDPDRCRFQVPE